MILEEISDRKIVHVSLEMEEVKVEMENPEDQSVTIYPPVESCNEGTDALEAEETESNGKKARRRRKKFVPTRATNGKTYCGTCGKSFVSSGSLELHMKIHLENKSFICKFCGRAFRRSHHLETHILSHQGIKPYECDICGKCFSEKRGLKNHLAIHNGVRQIACYLCEKRFWHTDGLRKHLNNVHRDKYRDKTLVRKRSDPCEICGKTFVDNLTLTRHMYIHTGEKEASCPICKKDFTRLSALYRHNRRRHNPLMAPKKRGKRKKNLLIDGSGFIDSENGNGKHDKNKNISELCSKSKRKNCHLESESAHEQGKDMMFERGMTSAADHELPSDLLAKIKDERVLSEDEETIPYCESSDEDDQLGTTIKTETEPGEVIGDKIVAGSERVSVAVTVRPGCSPFVHVKTEPADSDLGTDEGDLEPMIETVT